MGHTVTTCFYRFDKSFSGPESFNNFPGSANMAEMQAFLAILETIADSSWYPDSGATNHITPDESNLHSSEDYHGQQQIYMGNGEGLHIHNIGHSFLYSNSNSKHLVLNKLLHVPSITKNLLSVSQFANDNNVYFEFHPTYCCVKD